MLLKLYSFLLLSSFSMQAMDQEILMCPLPLKDLCADVVARWVDKQIPAIKSHKSLQDAYAILETPMFKKYTEFPEIHALIAKAYQELYSTDLLLWSKTFTGHDADVLSIAYSQDGSQLASGCTDNTIKIWDSKTGNCIKTLEGHNNPVFVAYSPDGSQLASGSSSGAIKLWDLETNQCIKTLASNGDWLNSMVYSPDGTQLASGSSDGAIKLWDLKSGNCIQELYGHNDEVYSVVYSPDGNQLASCSVDRTIKIWDLKTGRDLKTLIGHESHVYCVAYSPDGKQLASCSIDNTIRIWDSKTGNCIKTLTGHKWCVYCVAYSPDGKQLISGSGDKTIKIWNSKTGNCIKTLQGHTGWVKSVVYGGPNGKQVASGSDDKTIRIWESYNQNLETIEDVLFSILSSFYITTKPEKKIKLLINLYNSDEYKQLSDTHKQAFTAYIKRYTAEHPNSPIKELVKIIKQQNADKLVKQNEERGLQILFHK